MRDRISYRNKEGHWIFKWGKSDTDKKKRRTNSEDRPGTQQKMEGDNNE